MKLHEALGKGYGATKHVDGPDAGTYRVDRANFTGGYYVRFTSDDPERRTPVDMSQKYREDELARWLPVSQEDGWQKQW